MYAPSPLGAEFTHTLPIGSLSPFRAGSVFQFLTKPSAEDLVPGEYRVRVLTPSDFLEREASEPLE